MEQYSISASLQPVGGSMKPISGLPGKDEDDECDVVAGLEARRVC